MNHLLTFELDKKADHLLIHGNAKGLNLQAKMLEELAAKAGVTPSQLATLWVKEQSGITAPVIGPRNVEQLRELLPVIEMRLDDETRAACDRLVPPGSAAVNFFNTARWMRMQIL